MITTAIALLAILGLSSAAATQDQQPGYRDTPIIPGSKWRVHDADRPRPPVVVAPVPSRGGEVGKAPADALVLFDGKSLDAWTGKEGVAPWKIVAATMVVVPGTGSAQTVAEFGDCQLHIEWQTPAGSNKKSQGRSNSGVFFFGMYELQILDSFENITYADGQAGAIYGQKPPDVNVCRPPGRWNVFDIVFTAPRFEGEKLASPAYMTVIHNGVVVHNHVALLGRTSHRSLPRYTPHGPEGPITLQDHGDPIRFRNIWVRPLERKATR